MGGREVLACGKQVLDPNRQQGAQRDLEMPYWPATRATGSAQTALYSAPRWISMASGDDIADPPWISSVEGGVAHHGRSEVAGHAIELAITGGGSARATVVSPEASILSRGSARLSSPSLEAADLPGLSAGFSGHGARGAEAGVAVRRYAAAVDQPRQTAGEAAFGPRLFAPGVRRGEGS